MGDYAVSVICVTYNQQDYIRRALDSILKQQTNFKYEVIVRDDASTDCTSEIIKEYQLKYPDVVKCILNTENLFSKGIDFFTEIVTDFARGKYIALCEGDDYWIEDNKLQLQYDALEENEWSDMCACQAIMVSDDEQHILGEIRPSCENRILSAEEVILGGGMYLATASLFFRKSMYDNMMTFEKIRSLDYVYQIKGALRGGIVYIDRPMSAYRRYSKGSQTVTLTGVSAAMTKQCEQEKEILKALDLDTKGKYHDVITERLNDYTISYYDQLMTNREAIMKMLSTSVDNVYIWGMGLRGKALEKFCYDNRIKISGVCDIRDENVGGKTEYGNNIVSVSDAMSACGMVLASVEAVYNQLVLSNISGRVINMYKYMSKS